MTHSNGPFQWPSDDTSGDYTDSSANRPEQEHEAAYPPDQSSQPYEQHPQQQSEQSYEEDYLEQQPEQYYQEDYLQQEPVQYFEESESQRQPQHIHNQDYEEQPASLPPGLMALPPGFEPPPRPAGLGAGPILSVPGVVLQRITGQQIQQIQAVANKIDPFFKRTVVDLEACRGVVSKIVADKEVRITQELRAVQNAPPRPEQPIEAYRLATQCESKWNNMAGNSDQCRLCSLCNKFVYNFDRLQLPEAQKLIYQREGVTQPRFYRRKDGTFLNGDCPVAVSRGRRMLGIIVGAAVIFLGALAIAIFAPKPEPAPEITQETESIKTKQPSFDFGKAKRTASQSSPSYPGEHVDGTEAYRTNNSTTVVKQIYPWQRAAQQRANSMPGQYPSTPYPPYSSNNNSTPSEPEVTPSEPDVLPPMPQLTPQPLFGESDSTPLPPPPDTKAPAAKPEPAPSTPRENPYVKNY